MTPEEKREYDIQYRIKSKERISKESKIQYSEHKNKTRKYQKEYYQKEGSIVQIINSLERRYKKCKKFIEVYEKIDEINLLEKSELQRLLREYR